MKEILFIILSFILGILLYIVIKSSKCIEGMAGQTHYGKCCPIGYKFSPKIKKCMKVCDGCGPSSYNKMKLEWEKTGAYGMKTGSELVAYYDCDNHDASKIHGFDKLNNLYDHSEIIDQYDYKDEPKASEEKGNETWKNIQNNFGFSHTDFKGERSSIHFPFKAISTNLYYTGKNDCKDDYTSVSKTEPSDLSSDCRGYWKLDTTDSRFEYIKDDPNNYYPPPFMITKDPPDGISASDYKSQNNTKITEIQSNLNINSPVYDYYNTFHTNYDNYLSDEIDKTISDNVERFCDNSDSSNIIKDLCAGTTDEQKNRINASLCVENEIDSDEVDAICERFQSTDDMKMCKNVDNNALVDIKVACPTTTPVATTTQSE